jgi:hypothetical protein
MPNNLKGEFVRKWRKMTWVLVVWCGLILVWVASSTSSATHKTAAECAHPGLLTRKACEEANNAGTGIGIALIFFIGFFGFAFFSLIWFMTRPREAR